MNGIGLLKMPELGLKETRSSADWKHVFRATRGKTAAAQWLNHANKRISRSFLTAWLALGAARTGLARRDRSLFPMPMNSATWRPSVKRRARVKGGRPLFASGSNVAGHGEPLTRVQLQWIEGRIEDELLFGRPLDEAVADRQDHFVSFPPGECVALSRRTLDRRGTSISRLDIFLTVRAGEAYTTIPHVLPGGAILLSVRGWTKVAAVLEAIAAIRSLGIDPRSAAPDHWRHVHNRLAADLPPRLYSRERHAAFVGRSTAMERSR